MGAIVAIALTELKIGMRNRWVILSAGLLAAFALALSLMGSAPAGALGVDRLTVTIVSLASLSVYLIPLLALLIAYDALAGEVERGTMALLLTYPLARWQILAGKFLGHVTIVALAVGIGYGGVGALLIGLGLSDAGGLGPLLRLIGSSVLLGAAFIALGYLLSALARQPGTAAAMAIAVWVVMVLAYDLALLGILASDPGETFSATIFPWLLVANPADAFRLFNLTGFDGVELVSGMGSLAGALPVPARYALAVPALWALVALGLAALRFRKLEV